MADNSQPKKRGGIFGRMMKSVREMFNKPESPDNDEHTSDIEEQLEKQKDQNAFNTLWDELTDEVNDHREEATIATMALTNEIPSRPANASRDDMAEYASELSTLSGKVEATRDSNNDDAQGLQEKRDKLLAFADEKGLDTTQVTSLDTLLGADGISAKDAGFCSAMSEIADKTDSANLIMEAMDKNPSLYAMDEKEQTRDATPVEPETRTQAPEM